MKTNRFLNILAAVIAASAIQACDKFLDTMPDNRAEINSAEKIRSLLVSAYPYYNYLTINEQMSDNVEDIGESAYTSRLYDQMYAWQDITEDNRDAPNSVWEASYASISAANQALLAIEEMGGAEANNLQAEKAEALLCRAFNHFILVNTFCQNYNQLTSESDMGIPYMEEAETTLNPSYERGTVAEVYAKIDQDLQYALAHVSDAYYSVPKYHFNVKAAYAFAARFYLFYEKWELAEQYATKCLGDSPESQLRDWAALGRMTQDWDALCNQFVEATEKANLLLCVSYSIFGRAFCRVGGYYDKYAHSRYIADTEDIYAGNIWGNEPGYANNAGNWYKYRPRSYSGNGFNKVTMWKIKEFFEYTDPVAGIGYPHVVVPYLTMDECLLNRAEARIMLGQLGNTAKYNEAAEDLTIWMQNMINTDMVLKPQTIQDFYAPVEYATAAASTIKKHLNPSFSIGPEKELTECMIQCVLGFKRIENFAQGLRWWDVKRYGIEIWRRTLQSDGTPDITKGDNGAQDVLKKDDPRRAVQLPKRVIDAGLPANPR